MLHVLHQAPGPFRDLHDSLLALTARRSQVAWVSMSGTLNLFYRRDGHLVRTRVPAPGAELIGDGLPLVIEPPFIATTCGFADHSGYRSTPPLVVAEVQSPADVKALWQHAQAQLQHLVESRFDVHAIPPGHPDRPCGAMYCPATADSRALDPDLR